MPGRMTKYRYVKFVSIMMEQGHLKAGDIGTRVYPTFAKTPFSLCYDALARVDTGRHWRDRREVRVTQKVGDWRIWGCGICDRMPAQLLQVLDQEVATQTRSLTLHRHTIVYY